MLQLWVMLLTFAAVSVHAAAPGALPEPCLESLALSEAQVLRANQTRSTRIAKNRPYSLQDLTDAATPFQKGEEVPGRALGLIESKVQGRFLMSADLTDTKLGYPEGTSEFRYSYQPKPRLPTLFDDVPRADVLTVSQVYLASHKNSGSRGLVRLAEMKSGRKVAIKSYSSETAQSDILVEARSATLLEGLGIGPKFHGVFKDENGKWNIVMDVVPGDFVGVPATKKTLEDADIMIERLRRAGMHRAFDFQFFITPEGRLMAIDPGKISEEFLSSTVTAGNFVTIRSAALRLVEDVERVGLPYLEKLRFQNFQSWNELMNHMKYDVVLKTKFSTYIQNHQNLLKPL